MPESPVRYEVTRGVATITLNRPAVLNALDLPLTAALAEATEAAAGDPTVWVVVVRGAGGPFPPDGGRPCRRAAWASPSTGTGCARSTTSRTWTSCRWRCSTATPSGAGSSSRWPATCGWPRPTPSSGSAPPSTAHPRRLRAAPGAAGGLGRAKELPQRSNQRGGRPRDGPRELGGAGRRPRRRARPRRRQGLQCLAHRYRPRQAPAARLLSRGPARHHRGRAARPGGVHDSWEIREANQAWVEKRERRSIPRRRARRLDGGRLHSRDGGAHQGVSRVRGGEGREPPRAAGEHSRADRPRRGGEDHLLQPPQPEHPRSHPLRGGRHGSSPADIARLGLARSFQISAVVPHYRAGERAHRAPAPPRGVVRLLASERVLEALDGQALARIEAVGLRDVAATPAVELPYGRKRALEIATRWPWSRR